MFTSLKTRKARGEGGGGRGEGGGGGLYPEGLIIECIFWVYRKMDI